MSWTDPPDFTAGQILTSDEMDIISDDLNYLKSAPRLLGLGAARVAHPPPGATTGAFYIQGGSTVVTMNGLANGTVTFPQAFPTGVVMVIAINGDTSATNFCVNLGLGATTSSFDFHATGTGGDPDPASIDVRVDWLALGW